MLQPLRLASALPPASLEAAPEPESSSPANDALARVCAIEVVQCARKTKQEGASCYVVDVFQYAQAPPASGHAMLSPHWTAAQGVALDAGRAPDASVARPYLEVWALARALAQVGADCECQRPHLPRCRLCQNLVAYVKLMDRGTNALRRAVLTPILKQREIQELVGTFVAIVVRAQHAPARNAVRERNCANESVIAELLAKYLALQQPTACTSQERNQS